MIKLVIRYVAAFAVAVVSATATASIVSTQFVIAGLQGVGVEVPIGTRVAMTLTDLALLRIYAIVGGTAMLVAFPVAGVCARWLPGGGPVWYSAAGVAALTGGLMLIESTLGAMPVAGARSLPGLLLQGFAGAFGGWAFDRMISAPTRSP